MSLPEFYRITEAQRQAWAATYDFVRRTSPFYHSHFADAGLQKHLALEDITRIPTVDKLVLSERSAEFLCVPERKVVDIVTTSGSTGRPMIWKLTENDLERLALNERLSFECAGFTSEDTVLLAVAMDRCFIAGMAYFLGLRKIGCKIIRTGSSATHMQLDMLRRLRPSAIVGVPSLICLLGDKAAEAGYRAVDFGVRRAVCIGESLRNPDLSPNKAAEKIEGQWDARVFSTYGVTELAASLCECSASCGGHLHPELLFLECLDEAGNPLGDGEIGEITATTLGVEGMPVVRYRTGDYAALYHGPCSCGRTSLRMGPVVGRKNHKLKFKGTTLFPSTFGAILDSVGEVASYAIVARRNSPTSDEVEVKIACRSNPASILEVLRERFRGEAKVVPQITLATPAEIEELQLPEGTRKRRSFVDLRG